MIKFKKFHGSFNDFIIIDNREEIISNENTKKISKLLCSPKLGIGADGLILIENSNKYHFKWRFFNSDGSEAEMCGNGARCAARFAFLEGIAPDDIQFETLAGVIKAKILEKEVKIYLPLTIKNISLENFSIKIDEITENLYFINTGVPHSVIFCEKLQETDVKKKGSLIRFNEIFKPNGTNVNFVHLEGYNKISIRTYERGVEDETLSCGTGAVASSLVATLNFGLNPPISVKTQGGETLEVDFLLDREKRQISDVSLKGGAFFVFQGEISGEMYDLLKINLN